MLESLVASVLKVDSDTKTWRHEKVTVEWFFWLKADYNFKDLLLPMNRLSDRESIISQEDIVLSENIFHRSKVLKHFAMLPNFSSFLKTQRATVPEML